jgi:hypothetical protein
MNASFKFYGLVVTVVGLSAFTAVPLAQADASVNARQLAITERTLKFCGPLDPEAAKKLQAKLDQQKRGISDSALAEARKSEEYQKAYLLIGNFIAQVDEHNAKTLCADASTPVK